MIRLLAQHLCMAKTPSGAAICAPATDSGILEDRGRDQLDHAYRLGNAAILSTIRKSLYNLHDGVLDKDSWWVRGICAAH